MSEKNREAKRTARERLAAERAKQKAAEKRRRALIVGAAVVCVLGLAAVIGVVAANAGKDDGTTGAVVAPSGATGQDALAVPVGRSDAKSTLVVWEDFRCPACRSFEGEYRDTIHELTDAGLLRAEYRLATIIDGRMGGSGSRKAANAAACAQDAGKFTAYHDVLYENQPEENDDDFGDNAKLLELAKKVDGLDTPAFRTCVEDGTHDAWVKKSAQAFLDSGHQGTPTVLLNGQNLAEVPSMTPAKLKQMVQENAKG
ncbi:DsbA family protein [Streptomyces sp. XM83C]|uniref:DsbA family protein n=1 Tax=Streptomyces thermocoprophilus TaxID=78356 RepID=A0ABV5VFX7_9ACTN|nr:thioredoxin domain-containing protein [Streptomyces sp. XM83C]MCK1820379.1 DsbA family protein [Streptomyces sp. XM83C]